VAAGGPTVSVTLAVDPGAWFADGLGGLLDPRDPANEARISENIKNSVDAFHDHDRDGQRD
jgi:hypothetical protein